MSSRWNARRTHDLCDLQDAKPLVFHACMDCGKKVYQHNAKRCHVCALERKKKGGRDAYETRRTAQQRRYQEMLTVLGIRERDGDCVA